MLDLIPSELYTHTRVLQVAYWRVQKIVCFLVRGLSNNIYSIHFLELLFACSTSFAKSTGGPLCLAVLDFCFSWTKSPTPNQQSIPRLVNTCEKQVISPSSNEPTCRFSLVSSILKVVVFLCFPHVVFPLSTCLLTASLQAATMVGRSRRSFARRCSASIDWYGWELIWFQLQWSWGHHGVPHRVQHRVGYLMDPPKTGQNVIERSERVPNSQNSPRLVDSKLQWTVSSDSDGII